MINPMMGGQKDMSNLIDEGALNQLSAVKQSSTSAQFHQTFDRFRQPDFNMDSKMEDDSCSL
jgi:hypothetical protein